MQQLHRSLRRAQVATGQAQIGIHDPHQGQMREMPALCHDLRADNQVHLPSLDPVRGVGGGVGAGQRIAGHHQAACLGKQGGGFFRDALYARADRRQAVRCVAGRAVVRNILGMRAMVAGQDVTGPVFHQPRRAVWALHAVSAVPA